jgi:hypothetical protein
MSQLTAVRIEANPVGNSPVATKLSVYPEFWNVIRPENGNSGGATMPCREPGRDDGALVQQFIGSCPADASSLRAQLCVACNAEGRLKPVCAFGARRFPLLSHLLWLERVMPRCGELVKRVHTASEIAPPR